MKLEIYFLFFVVSSSLSAVDLSTLEDRVAQHPSDARALYNLGVGAFKAGDLKKAEASFSTLKSWCAEKKITKKQCVDIFYNAGNTEYKLNDYQGALASFESVLTYDPVHENAREKRDFIKQLLEQKKQEQQDKQDKKEDNKEQEKQDKKEQQDQQKQQDQKDQNNKKDGEQKQEKQNQDQNKQQDKQQDKQDGKRDQQDKQGKQAAEQSAQESSQESGGKEKKEPLTARQQQLVELAERLDNQAQEQIVRQQAGMRARGGQHDW